MSMCRTKHESIARCRRRRSCRSRRGRRRRYRPQPPRRSTDRDAPNPGSRWILPGSVVEQHRGRRRLLDHDNVGVAVGVQIADDDGGGGARVGEANSGADGAKRPVSVVVQQLVATIALDQQQIEIAVVVGVEQRAVDGGAAATAGECGRGDVGPVVPAPSDATADWLHHGTGTRRVSRRCRSRPIAPPSRPRPPPAGDRSRARTRPRRD